MTSYFSDKSKVPGEKDLTQALGSTLPLWQSVITFTHEQYPAAHDEWKFAGGKYGWSFRVNDTRRVIVYLLPFNACFQVSMVFGQKAFDQIMTSPVSDHVKEQLSNAKVYAEGRGIRITVSESSVLNDIFALIRIKLAN